MRNLKRLVGSFVGLLIIVSLAACINETSNKTAANTNTETVAQPGDDEPELSVAGNQCIRVLNKRVELASDVEVSIVGIDHEVGTADYRVKGWISYRGRTGYTHANFYCSLSYRLPMVTVEGRTYKKRWHLTDFSIRDNG